MKKKIKIRMADLAAFTTVIVGFSEINEDFTLMNTFVSSILLIMLFLFLWIGIGVLLLWFFNRPSKSANIIRTVGKSVYSRDELVDITLSLVPPVATTVNAEPHDIILVLDHSASMGAAPGSPLKEAIRSMRTFIQQLPETYQVGLVIFDHKAQILCNNTSDFDELLSAFDAVGSGGGTAIHEALNKALNVLEAGREGVNKTVILLSDGESEFSPAVAAANTIKEHSTQPDIICVGFGLFAHAELLKKIANREEHYIHINDASKLEALFLLLAQKISGETAVAGLLEERVCASEPFQIKTTGDLSPITIQPEKEYSQISWALFILQESSKELQINYQLSPICLGWHRVAPSGAQVIWKMPDGSQEISVLDTAGSKVLILPNGFAWTWPLLNPLFWLIFGRFISRCIPVATKKPNPAIAPAAEPTLPERIELPKAEIYSPKIKPALVIGLGELGEWSVSRLKWRLRDRKINAELIDVLTVADNSFFSRPSVDIKGVSVNDAERVLLQQNLRPYLEGLREKPLPASRNWLPVLQWLKETVPLTTYMDDRRKARLAFLQAPDQLLKTIKALVERIVRQEGELILLAATSDAIGSGLLAEIAHICASFSQNTKGLTVILVPDDRLKSAQTSGLVYELSRMLSMRDNNILSDRGNQAISAKRLFDRVLVLEGQYTDNSACSIACDNLVWNLLAYPELLEQMPTLTDGSCYKIEINSQSMPLHSLWEWVRERALAELINQQWLSIEVSEGHITSPDLSNQSVETYLAAFWGSGDLSSSLPGQLLQKSAVALKKMTSLVIMEDLSDLPFSRPEHEQRVFCDAERRLFVSYLQVWCYYILENEAQENHWGLPVLLASIVAIENDIKKLINGAETLSSHSALAPQIILVTEIYLDYLTTLGSLRTTIERWIACFTGWQSSMKAAPLPPNYELVALDIEEKRLATVRHLSGNLDDSLLQPPYQKWLDKYGNNLLQLIRFKINSDIDAQNFDICLQISGQTLSTCEAEKPGVISSTLRNLLNYYQNIIYQWPTEEWFKKSTSVTDTSKKTYTTGQFSTEVYSEIQQALNNEDPFSISSIGISSANLIDTFQLNSYQSAIYTWPEEANADRIASKMRNILEREPGFNKNPKIVSLMRDTEKLFSFMAGLASNEIRLDNGKMVLEREGQTFMLEATNPRFSGIDLFHDIARLVGLLGISWPESQTLPKTSISWNVSGDEAIKKIEAHFLIKDIVDTHEWSLWREVIRGLLIDNNGNE